MPVGFELGREDEWIIIRISKHAAFVGGDHVLDVDVGVLSPVLLQNLQGLLNQVGQVLALLLSVVDFIPDID